MTDAAADRLPAPKRQFLFNPALATLWLRPWFDWVGLRFVTRLWFPLSRAWAAAELAAGDRDRFLAESGLPSRLCGLNGPRLDRALEAVAGTSAAYRQASARWRGLFFDGQPGGVEALVAAEIERARSAHSFMASRRFFDRWRRYLPAARWALADEAAMRQRHGHRLADPAGAYPLPPPVNLQASRSVPSASGEEAWLAFDSPVLGDRVTARLYRPRRPAAKAPTLIWLHGIAMEPEMWCPGPDPVSELVAQGWQVVRPEGPWHGRRRPLGRYGGEPVIAEGPAAFLTLFQAWVAEVALLVDWARSQGGPVVLGGVSLGALTAQLYASLARNWPARQTPDALFLVATGGDVSRVACDGALACGLGMPKRLMAAGWTRETLCRWLTLLEPGPSAVPPERTLLVLGRADTITPYDCGCSLAAQWQLPPENVFAPWRGHFSVALYLASDTAPLRRLTQLVA